MLPPKTRTAVVVEQRKFELALQLTAQYKGLLAHWQWGDSVLEWIRQCEMTFEYQAALRQLLHPDVWPHAGPRQFRHTTGGERDSDARGGIGTRRGPAP